MANNAKLDDAVVIAPDFRHLALEIENVIKLELGVKLDTDEQICPTYLSTGECPLGSHCPQRHVTALSSLNFQPPAPLNPSAHARTVCKHWLRGLCKKGASCEFLHEYNLRKMPECWFFAKYGYCSNGDECMYLHVDDQMRRTECPHYRLGFCKDGPTCRLKHVRRPICLAYYTGFCPKGPNCVLGHPKLNLEEPPPFRSGLFGLSAPQGYDGANRGLTSNEQQNQQDGQGGRRRLRNTDDITCFKCGQKGHFANNCPNPSIPGRRGGVERGPGGRIVNG